MEWWPRKKVLAGRPIPDEHGDFHVALSPENLTLFLVGVDGSEISSRPLAGARFGESERWLGQAVADYTRGRSGPSLVRSPYEIPDHEVAKGGQFGQVNELFLELGHWYGNAHHALEAVRLWKGSAEVRCWPHHFDIATLISIEGTGDDSGKSVGVGMTPGDGLIVEPYWYVTPWPYPANLENLPRLGGNGHWHEEGWFGAVLTASDARAKTAETAVGHLADFLESAIKGAEALLSVP
jgi:hypothetical protein